MEKTDYEAHYRLLLPDGTIKYQHAIGRPIVNEKGDLVEFVGTAIDVTEQAQARIELEKACEEIKQRTEAARRSERELRDVVNTVPAHVWSTSPEGEVDFVNDRWLQFTGLTLDGASGWKWEAVLHPDDRTRVVADWHTAVKNGQATESEARVRRADGEYCWWFIRNVPLRDETGKIVRWYGTAIDIEDRKRAEQALRRSEAYLAEAHRLAKTGSWAYSPAAEKCIYWSDEMLRIFGLDPQRSNLPDREEFLRLVHPEDRDRFNERIDKAFSEKADFVQDYRIVLTDGTVKHIHGIGHPVLDETGNIVEYVGTDADVTERKRDEEALQRSESYLAEAQKLTHTGSWAAQVCQKENVYWSNVYWSKEMYRIFGLDPGPTPPSPMEVARRLHPEYAPDHPRVVERAIRGGTDFEIDHRLLLPDGTAKYVHVVGHPVLNASGDVTELVGTTMDVTEQHEARAALQAAFEKIKAEETELRRMTDAIASFIYVFRPDGTALYANQAVLDYTGLTLEEVQREDFPARIFHPEDVERLLEKRNETLARGKPFEVEKRELGKDGKYRWFLVRYNPLRDDQGHIIRWYATGTDIEDRKRAEESMRDENLALREQIDHAFMFEEIVGSSPALQTVLSSIVKVAPTDSTVLITGETGTGKELIARAIHKHSRRSGQAFISVNCASIPSSLIASELFGHEKGAFTGAVQRRQGRFEMAHSGTIFLDEVGELPAETQIALLRVLQERQFERVGGNRIIPTDVRVIAATNRDLTAAIAAGTFRADLFYRFNVFPIEVPPLRKRTEDIPMLVEYFVKRYAEKMGKQIRKIDKSTLERCQSYPWPGNIRELQNIVERSVILCGGDTFWIEKAWLASQEASRQELPGPLPDTLQNQERKIIETALAESKGKVSGPEGAAAKLGIPPSTLDTKIKQLGIKKHRFISK
jgi:PAS domain S-box-containing protein